MSIRTVLGREEWRNQRQAYLNRVRPWIESHTRRASRQIKHPVYDFLFEYYSFRPSYLKRWSPGVGVFLEQAIENELDWGQFFLATKEGSYIPAARFPRSRITSLERSIELVKSVASRQPYFGCFGLHEWAMVYESSEIRHSRVPLRVSSEVIAGVIKNHGVRCSHYDAYRFFTPAAKSLNQIELTRSLSIFHEQPGCIHANMDLYKTAYSVAPFINAKLIAESFELAIRAREIDMRASPYDLSAFGFDPLEIETKKGRDLFVREQQKLGESAARLRDQILSELLVIQSHVT